MNLDWGLGEGNDERKRRGEGSVGEVVAWGRWWRGRGGGVGEVGQD